MWIVDGILAGLIAGTIMGCVSQIGYWLGIHKSHLIAIDGKFFWKQLNQKPNMAAIYIAGVMIHIFTSMVFGLIYFLIAKTAGFELRSAWAISVYGGVLWLAMLFIALPASGQGFFGNKIHGYVWVEQLVLHIVFGLGFWWASGIF
jgi:hypothetical protein